jgi:hypothetical protein
MVSIYYEFVFFEFYTHFIIIYYIADPVGLIYDSLRIKRSKAKIKEKLLELNLAENAQQLRKKRTKKSSGKYFFD